MPNQLYEPLVQRNPPSTSIPIHTHNTPPEVVQSKKAHAGTLGTIDGVFFPCLLSIFGAILFLRLSWVVGQGGWIGALLMLLLGFSVVLSTAMSLAAISTNGSMKGGGPYFMISRSLGPEFGAAVGVIYTLALSVGVTFYIQAFAESFLDTFFCTEEPCSKWHESNPVATTGLASGTLALLAGVTMLGAKALSRLNAVILVALAVSMVMGIVSLYVTHGEAQVSLARFMDNAMPNFTDGTDVGSMDDGPQNFLSVFIVFFPALTGIMAGANFSGDLKDPAQSIGIGTIGALLFSIVVYSFMILSFAASIDRYSLQSNKLVFQQNCVSPIVVALGLSISAISSALGNLVGAGRVLQAFARDNLLPIFGVFAYGSKASDEPYIATAFCWLVAQLFLFVGDLDMIAGIISDCFLLVYFCLNLACFTLKVTGAPNFRPRFEYFSWHTALFGALMSLIVMFLTSPMKALAAIGLTASFAYYVQYKAPVVPWGDVTQALVYHQVRKYLLRLDVRKDHPKFWRPSILLVVDKTEDQYPLIDFCNNLKKGGLYVIGTTLVGEGYDAKRLADTTSRIRSLWTSFLEVANVKGFSEVAVGPTLRSSYQNLLLSTGLGGMKPNTVVLEFYKFHKRTPQVCPPPTPEKPPIYDPANGMCSTFSSQSPVQVAVEKLREIDDAVRGFGWETSSTLLDEDSTDSALFQEGLGMVNFCHMINDALFFEKNVIVSRNFELLNKASILAMHRKKVAAERASHFKRRVDHVKRKFGQERSQPTVPKELDETERLTIDIWSTDETDWEDPSGTLALQLQLAFGLHRTDIWEESTHLRVVAACSSVMGVETEDDRIALMNARQRLLKLLADIRVEAEVLVLPSVGAALHNEQELDIQRREESLDHTRHNDSDKFSNYSSNMFELSIKQTPASSSRMGMTTDGFSWDTESQDASMGVPGASPKTLPPGAQSTPAKKRREFTQLEHCAELNALVSKSSGTRATVVFLPLPTPPPTPTERNAMLYIENLRCLTQGLPPCILVAPGQKQDIVTTEI